MNRIFVAGIALTLLSCSQNGRSEADLQASCEALVVAETGVQADGVRATGTRVEPTGSVTTVRVEGAAAPWVCRADATGVVTGVEFSQGG